MLKGNMGIGFCDPVDLSISLTLPQMLLEYIRTSSKPKDTTTIIFEWNPRALHHLLDMEIEEFYCDADWEENSLKDSTPGERANTHSDSEISYRICNGGKLEIKSAQLRQSLEYNDYYITRLPKYLDDCKDIEEEMAQDMAKRFWVGGVLEDSRFPLWNYMSQAESAKEKSDGRRSKESKDIRLEYV
ncbi:hypothetical protein sscle_01g007020 [Sclerotinia sclerotiorum 1980 UF-70]|uniref:Uncharacterized protein n=2 Tax=Sclerotinia sclerotiorum (strain ATCC 18683 / 1980 / Ss-1) TaxID=665079 RepID=A0A1D9PTU2_SCLS1|nr:hypothetical protein sscle_01g007020 [Sclerotinia sclerotiorum 1980 UF-70]